MRGRRAGDRAYSNESPIVTGLIELILVERVLAERNVHKYVHSREGQTRPNRCRL
jgi:hypothetical protein